MFKKRTAKVQPRKRQLSEERDVEGENADSLAPGPSNQDAETEEKVE